MDPYHWLRDAGASVDEVLDAAAGDASPHAVVRVALGSTATRFAVEERRRTPYPNELPRLETRRKVLERIGHPLLVAPFVSEAFAPALAEAGWSWIDSHGNFDLRAEQLILRQRRTAKATPGKRKGLPTGSGSYAILRSLVRMEATHEAAATSLALQASVSQPRASQVLHQMRELGLVERTPRGRWRPDREALIDRFLADYAGPGGSEQYLYSLDSPNEVASVVASTRGQRQDIVVSADVGPDLIVAWRHPSVVVLYATHAAARLDTLGLVPAQGPADANVVLRRPADLSVFPVPPCIVSERAAEVALADPLQMIWDLQSLGGADRLEAAGKLREWLLHRP